MGSQVQATEETLGEIHRPASGRAHGPELMVQLCGMLVLQLHGLALPSSIVKLILEQLPHPRGGGAVVNSSQSPCTCREVA